MSRLRRERKAEAEEDEKDRQREREEEEKAKAEQEAKAAALASVVPLTINLKKTQIASHLIRSSFIFIFISGIRACIHCIR